MYCTELCWRFVGASCPHASMFGRSLQQFGLHCCLYQKRVTRHVCGVLCGTYWQYHCTADAQHRLRYLHPVLALPHVSSKFGYLKCEFRGGMS